MKNISLTCSYKVLVFFLSLYLLTCNVWLVSLELPSCSNGKQILSLDDMFVRVNQRCENEEDESSGAHAK